MTPYFSILIPTKNRSHIVPYAVQSVLDQTFEDFEILVIDNDDGELTSEALAKFSDRRVRYFRTGGLSMSENWEYGLDRAAGKYLTVLEDKQAYYPHALQTIYERIQRDAADVIVWSWDIYQNARHAVLPTRANPTAPTILTSDDILAAYVAQPKRSWALLPRMLNAAASLDVVKRIKGRTGHRFFSEVSPDLCAAFQLLSEVQVVSILNRSMGLVGYLELSNAKAVNRTKSLKYYGSDEIAKACVDRVPVKNYWWVHNTVYNDFLRIRDRVGGRLVKYQMTLEGYAALCLSDHLDRGPHSWFNSSDVKVLIKFVKDNGLPQTLLLRGALIEMARKMVRLLRRGRLIRLNGCDSILDAARSPILYR